jgi:2,3-bisphosphoglycerate-dependent phosphoglycerate mutase
MGILVTVRHGQSVWNKANRFTGWVDVELSEKGVEEAQEAGKLLKGYTFDEAYTSVLKRANDTLHIILKELGQENIPITFDKALNERMYGDLQGLNKAETAEKHGEEQVKLWRRSYDIAPPNGESLKDTAERVIPYFKAEIEPKLKAGKNILISAHGNSLRALVMHLEGLTPDEILKVEIGTGKPKVYYLNNDLEITDTKVLG